MSRQCLPGTWVSKSSAVQVLYPTPLSLARSCGEGFITNKAGFLKGHLIAAGILTIVELNNMSPVREEEQVSQASAMDSHLKHLLVPFLKV